MDDGWVARATDPYGAIPPNRVRHYGEIKGSGGIWRGMGHGEIVHGANECDEYRCVGVKWGGRR